MRDLDHISYIQSTFEPSDIRLYQKIIDKEQSAGDEKRHKVMIDFDIHLDTSHAFYKYLMDNTDLASVEIVCDKLTLDCKITLPGVDVSIFCA
ncbi:MAG: hypothetical protein ACRBB0_17695 [Pelagimonas sp.]|uniref:hypothetical protein n=1 Tax=Pelagimonas sp. TaxID=2073170 RepID=UPI003D6B03BF